MSSDICYYTGEEVRPGDRVMYRGTYATVVFVSDGENGQFAPGYEDYLGSDRGVTICDDDGSVSNIGEPDEQLAFVDRG